VGPAVFRFNDLADPSRRDAVSLIGGRTAQVETTAEERDVTQGPGSASVVEPWAFLLGRPPMDEYLSFLVQAAGTGEVDVAAAAARWRAAAEATDALTTSEAGAADGAQIAALPPEVQERADAYLADPSVAAFYLASPPTVTMIDLDQVVVFQRAINLHYAQELQQQVDASWDSADVELLNFSLGIDQPQAPIDSVQVAANAFVFSSVSTDVRFLDARLIDAAQITGHATAGRPQTAVVLQVGYGVNALSVVAVNGRMILNSGSHRAFALRAAGVTQVPAVLQTVTRQDEMAMIPQVAASLDVYLGAKRPPMLKDFFDPALCEVVQSPRRVRQIRLQFGVDQTDAPG
jgi:hypothetical protein